MIFRSSTHLFLSALLLLCAGWCVPQAPASSQHAERAKGFNKYLEVSGASAVGSDTCTSCHENTSKNFRYAFHKQQGIECEDCHGNGSLHVEGGGDIAKIVSLPKRSAQTADGVCLACHARDERVRHWQAGSHSSNHVRCMDCHQVHDRGLRSADETRMSFDAATRAEFTAASVSPETNVILRPRSATNDACVKCHQTQGAQLSLPYHHPLREGKMSCVDCHDPHGGPAGNNLRASNINQLCLGCHAQYRGPYSYQHPPVSENCMNCHTAHGSPNTNLLTVSEPGLCLQCHAGHHNGAGLPVSDRCTNCHGSIHGTDVATPSGGSRFVDKGASGVPAQPAQPASTGSAAKAAQSRMSSAMPRPVASHAPTYPAGAIGGALGLMSSGILAPMSVRNAWTGTDPTTAEGSPGNSVFAFTPGAYRFVDGTGYLGRVGEYDSLEQSAGADAISAYVSPQNHLTVVSHANVQTGNDYYATSQLTAGQRLQMGFNVRSSVQQQDHYPFYAGVMSSDLAAPDGSLDLIPSHAVFGVTRRIGNAHARLKLPKLPVRLFVNGDWQARSGVTQLAYLDENTTANCGEMCHYTSRFQQANYTTRNIGGGADVDLGPVRLTWEHRFSSFKDRVTLPTAALGPFTPGDEPPPSPIPVPPDVAAGNYYIDLPAPSRASTDSLNLTWTPSPALSVNGRVSYTRLRDALTRNPQNTFDSDETLTWRPVNRVRLTADYHQHNLINDFTPFYALYGNVSYHQHGEGLRLDYELPRGWNVEAWYRRSGISRSNASLWPQAYSFNNTDLIYVVPLSFSNTGGLALRYHDHGHWSARAGYEWTGTHRPGYLIVPQSNNRAFADLWLTPAKWLTFSNDLSIILQNAFPAIPLPNTFGIFQRRNHSYTETASATLRFVPNWTVALGYSYQQTNLTTYMAFQNDAAAGYVIDEPAVPYRQISQAYWGDSTYMLKQRLGVNFRLTYSSARSGIRPDIDLNHAAQLGNASLISQDAFDPSGLFPAALGNLQLAATQVSEVVVPQWIGQSKLFYLLPHKVEGGVVAYYGTYRDLWNPNLNGVLRTFSVYVGRSW